MDKRASESEPVTLVHPNGAVATATNDMQFDAYINHGFKPGKAPKKAKSKAVRSTKRKNVKKPSK